MVSHFFTGMEGVVVQKQLQVLSSLRGKPESSSRFLKEGRAQNATFSCSDG